MLWFNQMNHIEWPCLIKLTTWIWSTSLFAMFTKLPNYLAYKYLHPTYLASTYLPFYVHSIFLSTDLITYLASTYLPTYYLPTIYLFCIYLCIVMGTKTPKFDAPQALWWTQLGVQMWRQRKEELGHGVCWSSEMGLGKLTSNSLTHMDLHKPNNKLVSV